MSQPSLIVLSPPLVVAEYLIREVELRHLLAAVRTRIDIRVMHPSQTPIGGLDHLWFSIRTYLEDFVQVVQSGTLPLLGVIAVIPDSLAQVRYRLHHPRLALSSAGLARHEQAGACGTGSAALR